MSFLDRFQDKIATVTAHGHLKRSDGSEEIRMGVPIRKSKCKSKGPEHRNTASVCRGKMDEVSQSVVSDGKNVQSGRVSSENFYHGISMHKPIQSSPCEDDAYMQSNQFTDSAQQLSHSARIVSTTINAPENAHDLRLKSSARSEGGIKTSIANIKKAPRMLEKKASENTVFVPKYQPCSLAQYKKEKPDSYYELGKLQPDLNTQDLIDKRAVKDKIKSFSQNLREQNKCTQRTENVLRNDTENQTKALSKRERALQFAKQIPKPRAFKVNDNERFHSKRSSDGGVYSETEGTINNSDTNTYWSEEEDMDEDVDNPLSIEELQELQQRHHASRAQVDALIRKH